MAAGFRGPSVVLGRSAAAPVITPGFRGLLAFWAGGAARGIETADAPPVGGGYDDARRKRLWVARRLAELNAGLEPEPVEPTEPEDTPSIEEIRTVAKARKQGAKVERLIKAQDYSEVLALYERLREEDDIETLLLLL